MKSNFLFIQAKPHPFLHFTHIFHQERFLNWDPDHVAVAGMFLLSHCGLCSLSHALLAVKWCFKAIHTTKAGLSLHPNKLTSCFSQPVSQGTKQPWITAEPIQSMATSRTTASSALWTPHPGAAPPPDPFSFADTTYKNTTVWLMFWCSLHRGGLGLRSLVSVWWCT